MFSPYDVTAVLKLFCFRPVGSMFSLYDVTAVLKLFCFRPIGSMFSPHNVTAVLKLFCFRPVGSMFSPYNVAAVLKFFKFRLVLFSFFHIMMFYPVIGFVIHRIKFFTFMENYFSFSNTGCELLGCFMDRRTDPIV